MKVRIEYEVVADQFTGATQEVTCDAELSEGQFFQLWSTGRYLTHPVIAITPEHGLDKPAHRIRFR